MSNMSYCRFENTSRDLAECVNALDENDIESKSEFYHMKKMIDYCSEFIELAENYQKEWVEEFRENEE